MIPSSVSEAYQKILSRVPPNQKSIVKKVLQIIIGARRPLTIAEMAEALDLALSSHIQPQPAAQARIDPLQLERKLRHLCGLFVFVKNSKIYLIHQTAREFLIKKANSDDVNFSYSSALNDIEKQMALLCVQYLLLENLGGNTAEQPAFQNFLEYSAVHWASHVRHMTFTSGQEMAGLLNRLYDTRGKRFALWFPILWKAVAPYLEVPQMSALHLAAFNGHEQQVSSILAIDKGTLNTPDTTGTYPVIWASLNGHEKTVQILLEQGADIHAQDGLYGNALQAASNGGHDKIVQILLEQGADINAQGGLYGNALQAACYRGHDKIVQILLERGADINALAQDGHYRNALQAASNRGHNKIVQILLEQGANINAQGGLYGNALQAASNRGHNKIVQILLEQGANINAQGGLYGNALQAASNGGHDKIVQILLEQGADINAQGGLYGNALQAACYRGHDKIVQILLERGADINALAQDGHYRNALQAASNGGHNKIVQILLEQGANINAQGGLYGNALQAACARGHGKIAQMLLEQGADINAQGGEYGNVLEAARQNEHYHIVQILQKYHCADQSTYQFPLPKRRKVSSGFHIA
ncbi:hypothetical protein PEX2_020310 [Penicillium expansum]|uniref:GPI inositol-deacylase winged helix domain-containing protein n=1 Tax=Penicillium expansum TaxID=27334 RepID=A0A0A2JQ82_PENEN|nr:hypothetical protein PEX2_020310 [Penicillium expansum]KGO57587.1 hypothetical protein PEX2_020310 [Penicillium expansum]